MNNSIKNKIKKDIVKGKSITKGNNRTFTGVTKNADFIIRINELKEGLRILEKELMQEKAKRRELEGVNLRANKKLSDLKSDLEKVASFKWYHIFNIKSFVISVLEKAKK